MLLMCIFLLFGKSSAGGFCMEVPSEGDSRLFLFLIVNGIMIVCVNKPWGVVDNIVEVDEGQEGSSCIG